MQLVVKRTTCQLIKHNGIEFGVLCSWDGHDIELDQDPATTVKIIRQKFATLKVGDRLQARGLLVVKLHFNSQNRVVLRFRLRIHQTQTVKEVYEASSSTDKSPRLTGLPPATSSPPATSLPPATVPSPLTTGSPKEF